MILILMESKKSGAMEDEICKKLGKNRWIRSEDDGFNGGVWLLWKEEDVEVNLR